MQQPHEDAAREAPEVVSLIRGAARQLGEAMVAGRVTADVPRDGAGHPRAVVLDELAGLVSLVAVIAQTTLGRRSVEVEAAAGEFLAALCALRDDLTGSQPALSPRAQRGRQGRDPNSSSPG
jgi:hypothetical protein